MLGNCLPPIAELFKSKCVLAACMQLSTHRTIACLAYKLVCVSCNTRIHVIQRVAKRSTYERRPLGTIGWLRSVMVNNSASATMILNELDKVCDRARNKRDGLGQYWLRLKANKPSAACR